MAKPRRDSRGYLVTYFFKAPYDNDKSDDQDYHKIYIQDKLTLVAKQFEEWECGTQMKGQCEACPTTKKIHLQAFMVLTKQLSKKSVLRYMTELEDAQLDPIANIKKAEDYALKQPSRLEDYPVIDVGVESTWSQRVSAGKLAKSKGTTMKAILQTGTRGERLKLLFNSLVQTGEAAMAYKVSRLISDNPENSYQIKTQAQNAKEFLIQEDIRKKQREAKDVKLRPWQEKLYKKLMCKPHPRTVFVILDKEGNKGKTWFHLWYKKRHPNDAFVWTTGKSDDLKYQILKTGKKYGAIFLDLCRNSFYETESNHGDYVSYSMLEEVKNGYFTCGKYEGGQYSSGPPHLVIFTNHHLQYDKMSHDRWVIQELSGDIDGNVTSTVYKVRGNHDGPMKTPDGRVSLYEANFNEITNYFTQEQREINDDFEAIDASHEPINFDLPMEVTSDESNITDICTEINPELNCVKEEENIQ